MGIVRPVFLIGAPRSGTTVIYEALALHEELAWFSNYSVRFPRLRLAAIAPRVYELPLLRTLPRGEKAQNQRLPRLNRFLPKPIEGYTLWDRWCGPKFSKDYLLGVRASEEERRQVRRAVSAALWLQGKKRFVAKFTGPPRIEYLASIFPDAVFMHVVRDGRAVVNSLLNVGFWVKGGGLERPWWQNGLPDGWRREWEQHGESAAVLAAIQWRTILEVASRERALLGPDQYVEIKYEEFVNHPSDAINRLLQLSGMGHSGRVDEYVSRAGRYGNMNRKYLARFSSEEIRALEDVMGEWLARLGYSSRARPSPKCGCADQQGMSPHGRRRAW